MSTLTTKGYVDEKVSEAGTGAPVYKVTKAGSDLSGETFYASSTPNPVLVAALGALSFIDAAKKYKVKVSALPDSLMVKPNAKYTNVQRIVLDMQSGASASDRVRLFDQDEAVVLDPGSGGMSYTALELDSNNCQEVICLGSAITGNSIYIKGMYDTTGTVLISGTGISITLEIQEVTETVV